MAKSLARSVGLHAGKPGQVFTPEAPRTPGQNPEPAEAANPAPATSARAGHQAPLLEARGVSVSFSAASRWLQGRGNGTVPAVQDVSLKIGDGETLGLVGESGCGKSTLGRALLQLPHPDSGTVLFEGHDLTELSGRALRAMRRKLQMVFQDPRASFNPRMPVKAALAEPLRVHRMVERRERADKIRALLGDVGLSQELASRYPHELSGGQLQRVAIARAIATEPALIVADEPTSALDVSVQAQIIELFESLQERLGLACLFISHDLGVIRQVASRVAVMYLGRVVEVAPREDFYAHPLHPYAGGLLAAVPIPDPVLEAQRAAARSVPKGEVPDPLNPPGGCPFHPRCPKAMELCRTQRPALSAQGKGRFVACHLYPES